MEVEEIRGPNHLRAWLEALPHGTATERERAQRISNTVAYRVAMRVFPIFWRWSTSFSAQEGHWVELRSLRLSLTTGVFIERPTFDNQVRVGEPICDAESCLDWLSTEGSFTPGSPYEALQAARGARAAHAALNAARASLGDAHATAAGTLRDALDAHDFLDAPRRFFWHMLRSDCAVSASGQGLKRRVLWAEENPFAQLWADTRPKILARGDGWQFWVDWYENALHGRPQDWDLLTKIALISSEDWDKGADHVNALIAEIRAEHIAETRPLGEDAIDKGADGLWRRVGRSDIDRDILQDAIDAVRDDIRDLRGKLQGPQGNMFTALVGDLDLLEARIARYPDRPLRLHDAFLRVQGHIVYNLDCGELPDDLAVRDFAATLGTAALDMRNACETTKAVVSARMAARFGDADEDARATLRRLADAAAHMSDAPLAAEFREDAATATDPEAPESEKKPAQYRLSTRLSVMVTRDGGNILAALKEIGAIGGGVTSVAAACYAILRFVVGG